MSERTITVYWRPGCGFCTGLLRGLERAGLSFDRVDIWQDPDAASFVRSVADGNETVPTVRVGSVALVNPSGPEVLRTVATELPDRLPEGYEPPRLGLLARAVTRVLDG
ncbi:MAG TPA: glutaredoxin domain-containing protein [Nitriliruptorales bacterium]